MRVHRIDVGTLAKPVRRADGSVIVQAKLARTGVQVYRNDDGTPRREYRPASQVFDQRSVDSFKLVPFTNDHPPEMITSENARQYMVGTIGQDIHRDGAWMVATIAIYDKQAVADLDSGKTEVSNGYDCDLEMTPGTSPDGEHYDAIQTNITGNHVALVWNARAGQEAAIRMDAAAAIDGDNSMADSELKRVCESRGVRFDAADQRGSALTLLAKCGHPANELTSNGEKLHQRTDAYLEQRAILAADLVLYADDRYATVPKERTEHTDEQREDAVYFDEYDPRLGGEFRGQLIGKYDAAYETAYEEMIERQQTEWIDLFVDTQLAKPVEGDIAGALAYAEKRRDMKADMIKQVTAPRDLLRHAQETAQKTMRAAAPKQDTAPSGVKEAREAMLEHNRNSWKGGK